MHDVLTRQNLRRSVAGGTFVTDARHESATYGDLEAVVRAHTPEPEPLPQLRALRRPADRCGLREQFVREMSADGVEDAEARDMLGAKPERPI
jgi:hypothetical protein